MISLLLGESTSYGTTSLIEENSGGIYSKMTLGSPKNICGSTSIESSLIANYYSYSDKES